MIEQGQNALLKFAFCLALCAPFAFAAVPDGYVVRVDSPTVYLDWTQTSGVKVGDRFQIYRAGAELKHPVTGEVLGHTQIAVAEGSVERIEEKFSTGRLYQASLPPAVGDRTHYEEITTSAAVVPTAVPGNLALPLAPLTELWRSDPQPNEVIGLAIGSVKGDGHAQIVVASADKIEIFEVASAHLTSVAVYETRSFRHCLGVETGDPGHTGHDNIFATLWQDSMHRPHVVVLQWVAGKLKQVGSLDGFVRSIQRADGSKEIVWQSMLRGHEKSYGAPATLVVEKGVYKPGPALSMARIRDDQLFGFTLGDWDHDKTEDFALLEGGQTLRVFLKEKKWSAGESYGGSKNNFKTDDQNVDAFPPRLIAWPPSTGTEELIVPRNAESGLQFTYVKFYRKSDITGFAWNGSEMAPVWQQPIDGYISDITTGDGLNAPPSQLWVAATAPDGKTILLAYRLP